MSAVARKICLLGDFAVGKTSLIRRFVEGRFDESYLSTIGVQISRRTVTLAAPDVTLNLYVWDTAGSEPFTAVVRSYYQGARGAILVCDLTRPDTLQSLTKYVREMSAVNKAMAFVVVGNKVDLAGQREISDAMLDEAAQQYNAPWFLSSARTGENVEEAFQVLAGQLR
ncbi:MAG: GTP-binding protein [Candidatus Viridilinea halotolerans]|uniref:GTP-binding protein n=1 Tax=Candidatus Viridilinea halotolerans TaxID=2491704 RepID=A0A426U2N0_9CHLR|nr:MAG: GTP-binding protein [Candidatus Viridilinea halotolerans]